MSVPVGFSSPSCRQQHTETLCTRFKELPQLPALSYSVCTFCVWLWVWALQGEVRDYKDGRFSFVSVLVCEFFSSPCYMRMSYVLWVHSNALILLRFSNVKIKMLLSGAPTSPAYSFVSISASLRSSLHTTPRAVYFFPASCAVLLLIVWGRTPCWIPPETGQALQLRLPPPRTFPLQDTRHPRNTICLISPPALQSAPPNKNSLSRTICFFWICV